MSRILAIAGLRFKLVRRSFRSGAASWLNALAGAVLTVLSAVFALSGGVAFAILIPTLARDGVDRVRIGYLVAFYFAFLFGFLLPLLRARLDQDLDVKPFVIYPLGRRQLFGLALGASALAPSHLFYYPSILAIALVLPVLLGPASLVGISLIGLLMACAVCWSFALSTFVASLMRGRRMRETLSVIAFTLLILLSMVPAMADRFGLFDREEVESGASADAGGGAGADDAVSPALGVGRSTVDTALAVVRLGLSVLPPSLAANGVASLHARAGLREALASGVGLLLWCCGGVLVGYVVFSRSYLGERLQEGGGPERRASTSRLGARFRADAAWLSPLPLAARAVAAKELRYLTRSTPGRLLLVLGPAIIVLFSALIGADWSRPVLGLQPQQLRLYGLVVYAALISSNYIYNAFAWDGAGATTYFSSPVAGRSVLLGKNLAAWLLGGGLFAVTLAAWVLLARGRSLLAMVNAFEVFLVVLLLATAAGNLTSVVYPLRRDISRPQNQPAQLSLLVGVSIFAASMVLVAVLLLIPLALGRLALQPLFLAFGLAFAAVVYVLATHQAGRLLEARRERLLEALRARS